MTFASVARTDMLTETFGVDDCTVRNVSLDVTRTADDMHTICSMGVEGCSSSWVLSLAHRTQQHT